MSKTKETETVAETVNSGEANAAEATVPEKVDYDKLVPYFIPRDDSAKKSKTIRLSLNGKSITVPRGQMVEIPLKYKLILEKKSVLRDMDDSYKEALAAALAEGAK